MSNYLKKTTAGGLPVNMDKTKYLRVGGKKQDIVLNIHYWRKVRQHISLVSDVSHNQKSLSEQNKEAKRRC